VVARNANEAVLVPMVGSGDVCDWRSLESGGRFRVGAFSSNLASVAVKMFTHLVYYIKTVYRAVPWLRSLVSGLSPRRPGFAPGSIHAGFVVDKVTLGQVFLRGGMRNMLT
jgi:hypothetical protein